MMDRRYESIIGLEHHTSSRHRRMSALDRAAQFAPFAALTGYEAVIAETGRQTSDREELDEEQLLKLDTAMYELQERLSERPHATFVRFLRDERKSGGRYVTVEGKVRNIDMERQAVILSDDTAIPFDDIYDITLS